MVLVNITSYVTTVESTTRLQMNINVDCNTVGGVFVLIRLNIIVNI